MEAIIFRKCTSQKRLLRQNTSTKPSSDRMRPPISVPVGDVVAAVHVMDSHGYHADDILAEINVSSSFLKNGANKVSWPKYAALVDHVLDELEIQAFGLKQGFAERYSCYGVVGVAFSSASCLREALGVIVKYQRLVDPVGQVHLNARGNDASLVFEGLELNERYIWSVENSLSGLAKLIHSCLSDLVSVPFLSVHLQYSPPKYVLEYEKVFDCPIYFSQETNEMRFSAEILDLPLEDSNTVVFELALKKCQDIDEKSQPSRNFIEQVEAAVLSVPNFPPTIDVVATALGFSNRTFSRYLLEHGTSYRKLLERLKACLSAYYLLETEFRPKQIAYLLGYNEVSNFYHAFDRWHGCSPVEFKSRNAQNDTPLASNVVSTINYKPRNRKIMSKTLPSSLKGKLVSFG